MPWCCSSHPPSTAFVVVRPGGDAAVCRLGPTPTIRQPGPTRMAPRHVIRATGFLHPACRKSTPRTGVAPCMDERAIPHLLRLRPPTSAIRRVALWLAGAHALLAWTASWLSGAPRPEKLVGRRTSSPGSGCPAIRGAHAARGRCMRQHGGQVAAGPCPPSRRDCLARRSGARPCAGRGRPTAAQFRPRWRRSVCPAP